MVGLLDQHKYGEHFYELYTNNTRRKLQNDRKSLAKRRNKDKKAGAVAVLDGNVPAVVNPLDPPIMKYQLLMLPVLPANIELEANASKFSVFAAIRLTVLEAEARYAIFQDVSNQLRKPFNMSNSCCLVCAGTCLVSNPVDCSCHTLATAASILGKRELQESINSDGGDSETEDVTEKEPVIINVPLLVGAGLRSLFELIADARHIQPTLCTKALKALLDVIQGQQPESFKTEPDDLIAPLYNLLLDLATMSAASATNSTAESNWSAMACAALIGLCIARGDTGKTLKAISAMLMSPKQLSTQIIQLPAVLLSLQRTTLAAAFNKPTRPDYHTHGIPRNSLVDEFGLKLPKSATSFIAQPAMASDGIYLYLLLGGALIKVGSGFSGSYKGHIYRQNDEFTKEPGWLGYCNNQLYFRRSTKHSVDHLHIVNTETLIIKGVMPVNVMQCGLNYALFTDEDSLNAIYTNREDSLVVKKLSIYNPNVANDGSPFELPLQMARKKFRTLGYAAFEDEILNQNQIQKIQSSYNSFEPKLPCDGADILGIVCGKEFGIVRDSNGKVYYYGKATSLGLKSIGRTPSMKLTELIISKVANIIHIACGHDGIHTLLVNEDGTVYFAGTARRGEDGDTSKNRRQPKAVKPKKMSKVDGHVIVHAACNNGTSAFVTKTGKLIMFGKDTAHCDSSGVVTDFADSQNIAKVALGKAHCVALNSKGQLFTFGLNNKGQCGRAFVKIKDASVGGGAAESEQKSNSLTGKSLKFDYSNLCDYDDHNLVQGQCRVCVVCRECTGYNMSCVSSLNMPIEERVAGAICSCGHGCSGCVICGICSTCIATQEAEHVLDDGKDSKTLHSEIGRQRAKGLIIRRKDKRPTNDEHVLPSEMEKDPPRVAPLPPQMLVLPPSAKNSPVVQIACGLHHTVVLTLAGDVFTFGSNQYGQLGTGDLQPVSGPVKVNIHGAVSQIAAGSNHTIVLTIKGIVYTFGNYQKGQLGRLPNDFHPEKSAAVVHDLSYDGSGISSARGAELGRSSKDTTVASLLAQRQKFLWHCAPGIVFGLGPNYGKKATWIGASGDQTFIKVDESLITNQMLSKINVVANKKTILLIPNIPLNFNVLSINRRDGNCMPHSQNQVRFIDISQNNKNHSVFPEVNQNFATHTHGVPFRQQKQPQGKVGAAVLINEQMSRSMHEARNQIFELQENQLSRSSGDSQRRRQRRQQQEPVDTVVGGPAAEGASSSNIDKTPLLSAFALDPQYNVLWVYNGAIGKMQCYNVLASEIAEKDLNSSNYRAILSPTLSLPCKSTNTYVSRSQAALNLLACLDVLTSAQDAIPGCFEDPMPKQQSQRIKESHNSEYQTVNRFENFGGGWGYSGHSVEAIRFSSDTDVMIYGFGMFGGRGEYTCKLKVFDLGVDGGTYEKDGILLTETKDVPFECAARSKHHILLPKPINATAGRWYLVWARIAGPSSDCGSCGQASVTTEDQVVFIFKSSKKANNGTDVNSGQIPSILYRLITQETKQPSPPIDIDPVQRISKSFAFCVSKECFESLVVLLNWSWDTFKANFQDLRESSRYLQVKQSLEYLVYVNRSCLRLLRKYTNEIYPYNYTSSSITVNNAAAATSIAAALTKLQTRLGKNNVDNKDKNAKAVSNAVSTAIAKYFGEVTATSTSATATGTSPTVARKPNMENIQLAECIGNVRALLINIFCDELSKDVSVEEGHEMVQEILEECHKSFVACFDAFYPTSSLKWNCLCDLLTQMDKGFLHSRLLSAILAGLCSPSVKLRATFSLLSGGNERQSIISPSDNSGLPMLSSTDAHQYPILVEQMIYRTQQEKSDFLSNSWSFKDVLVRLLDIIANPIRNRIESVYNRTMQFNYTVSNSKLRDSNQGLINNCCHLLARVLAEIVYHTTQDYDKMFLPPRSIHSTGSRFARCDSSRTWNTGNFGPDAIAFSVDRSGIAIAGALVYSGSGSYDYQLELLYDNTVDLQSQHKWEAMESVSGSYDQEAVHNDMVEIKFDRPIHIKENSRYALRLCSQGARTCSGDAGVASLRGPCGSIFSFYACDLSFNGTTPQRGQIPCILYYSTPVKNESTNNCFPGGSCGAHIITEVTARDTALQITADITKKCTELLILARNALAASVSPSDNSSSNHTQTIDSEHNITPIEEHMDVNWANNSRTSSLPVVDPNMSTARDITKRIESFSKGLMETLKFEKRSTNPFEMEIEMGATEIEEGVAGVQDLNLRNGQIAKLNGNERIEGEIAEDLVNAQHQYQQHQLFNQQQAFLGRSDSDEAAGAAVSMTAVQTLDAFNLCSSGMFHTLLPLVYAYVANLACNDPKSSVQVLGLIKEILPHVAALNQLHTSKNQNEELLASAAAAGAEMQRLRIATSTHASKADGKQDAADSLSDNCTTSNHYCIVESEHPYRSAAINCYRVEFPTCVQWLTLEFDPQCGTSQLEDYLLISIPLRNNYENNRRSAENSFEFTENKSFRQEQKNVGGKNAKVWLTCCDRREPNDMQPSAWASDNNQDWVVVKKFNTASNWTQNVMILPGNCVEFSLETASLYAQDPHINKYGFKCLVVGYDNPAAVNTSNYSLFRLEQELAYLGGMCSANLMKKDLNLPDDKDFEDLAGVEETINTHHSLLSKGFALSESTLSVHQALETFLPIGSQSNERQFLKDFISGAPGSSGGRLAAWLQPEPRLDPNKCELNTITESLRYGWPTQVTVTIRDQYGDAVLVPDLKVEIKAIPTGSSCNGNIKMRRASYVDNTASFGGLPPPPRISYEPTIKDKMCFKAITFMKSLSNYSFEELRFSSPVQTRVTESLFAQDMKDGTFSVHWTPNSVGNYCLTVTIDGILLEEVYRVEVKEGSLPPPLHTHAVNKPQPPNKLRRFFTRNTAGLRIRSHPTLQSEQVGVVKLNGIISFIDEIDNDDGTWLRLSTESIRQHCTMGWYPTEAWCLQYNQHLGKMLLHPASETTTTSSAEKSPSRPRNKKLLTSIESPVSPVPIESPGKPSTNSQNNKKMFEFAQSPPSKVSETQPSSTNPFIFPQSAESPEKLKDFQHGISEMQTSSGFSDSLSKAADSGHQREQDTVGFSSGEVQSNISSAIAGVVGEGASKLQALQKWLKGDIIEEGNMSGKEKEPQRKRSEVSEMATASVRELVRVMGGQEARLNGNQTTQNRASEVGSGTKKAEEWHGSKRAIEREGASNVEASAAAEFDVVAMRATNFTPSQTAALLSTPKHTPRKIVDPKHSSSLTPSAPSITHSAKDLTSDNFEDEEGLLQVTTSSGAVTSLAADEQLTFGETKTASTTASSDISSPPVWPFCQTELNAKLPSKPPAVTMGPIKRAMPPSLAESIRAVFAAFLWHEGVVHDAMACASFLKFHPNLPKEGATVVTRHSPADSKIQLSKEQKAQQRHSVEVANAGNYLNIRPSTLETLTKCGNSSVNNRKYRKNLGNNDETQKLLSLPEVVTVLPPALRCLVYLWEQVCAHCIHIVQSNTLEREKAVASPVQGDGNRRDSKEKLVDNDKDGGCKKSKRKKKDDGSWCEICELFLPIPVTYHMRIVHPGCGKSAKGKGYNSVGIFCEGWAGNCGEGGKGASSWFLMCDTCREKYMSSSKNTNTVHQSAEITTSVNDINLFGEKATQSLIANSEIYTTMRENATFLLELCSSNVNVTPPPGDVSSNHHSSISAKRSPQQMPVVIEHQHFSISESNRPSTSRGEGVRNSRIGLKMSTKFGGGTPSRKSLAGTMAEHMWVAPESFACLGSLGGTTNEDLPYEILGKNALETGYERPLSEISYDSCDANAYEVMTGSGSMRLGGLPGTLTKFHRSFSMGQGWAMTQQQSSFRGLAPNLGDENQTKVVFRRRNNSTSEGDGSLLICYPSENLRKLVPDGVLVTSAVQRIPVAEVDKNNAHQNNSETKADSRDEAKKNADQNLKYCYASKADVPQIPMSPVTNNEATAAQFNALLGRPSMCFMTQKHDLEKLRYAMKRSLRIATCRIYSLQALNWLLRSVTQSVCLHDLMWWFVSSLRIPTMETPSAYEDAEPALEHPVSYTQISGRFSHMITHNLHIFLQAVADLTLYLPLSSPLQRIAIQCFGIRFRQADHQFLHNAHVFGNISKILSKSDEQDDNLAVSTMATTNGMTNSEQVFTHHDAEHNMHGNSNAENFAGTLPGAKIVFFADLQGLFELTVSSRPAMVESLTDNSTETFWESDEEDRNRCKAIDVSMTKLSHVCKMVLVHIDNSRDIQNKVLNIAFFGGQSLGDTQLMKSVDVDQKTCGWVSAKVTDENFTHFRLEFNGPENTLRVRQIKLLGLPSPVIKVEDQMMLDAPTYSEMIAPGGEVHIPKSNIKFMTAIRIQQQICEAETLRVFRLITGQVFGKLICTASTGDANKGSNYESDSKNAHALGMDSSSNSMLADSLDMHTHMVGILFSRSKLSHLQKQVIVHIVYAIRKEAQRSKEDWEVVNLTNCFKQMQATTTNSATAAMDAKSESSVSDRYRAPDTYCFEMLNLVLALSGSAVGRSYLSHQHGLLKDLLSLLHTGSDRVQRQVTALLRRILPEISPDCFAELLGVQRLPPVDYNIAHQHASVADFDMNRLGLLDVLLAVIAKSLQLQMKVKMAANKSSALERNSSFIRLCNSLDLSVYLLKKPAKHSNEEFAGDEGISAGMTENPNDPFCFDQLSAKPKEECPNSDSNREPLTSTKKETKKNLNQRWFLNGVISSKQAESIIFLVRDLASGKLSQKWSQVTKAAVAEAVLNLTRLDEVFRNPENCVKTATLWLALASLCVLDREHVEKLSSGQWAKVSDTHPICSNHDDGVTGAIIQCESCGSLCGDCDRFLHLSRKTRTHKRTVCKEEEEAIRVELHESCGRIKLFWLLALADSKTLKAMVEFRDGSHTIISGPVEAVGRCRFCGVTGNSGLLEIGNVCCDAQCQEYAANSCMRTKPCGHPCGGVVNEKKCLPCLQHVCHARENELADEFHEPKLTQDADDMCMICFVEALSSAPSIHLECGHVFHFHCCRAVLEKRWMGPRITFGFSLCPICKTDIQHPLLLEILEPINGLKQDVKRKALMRIKYEGVVKESDSKDLTNIAMDRYAYYVCFKCQKAYYGGEARCDVEIGEKYDPEELVCGGCSDVARAQMCPKHGTDFLEYKCRYCCSVAVFFCFGTTHFCDTCHDDFQRLTNIPKSKLPQCPAGSKATQLMGDECPLHVMHPPTGEEFALGCGVCRNAQTF